jgi:hypothetical protein
MHAAVAILFGLVVLLLLAVIGLLQRVFRIEARLQRIPANSSTHDKPIVEADRNTMQTFFGNRRATVLVVDEMCVTCRDVLQEFSTVPISSDTDHVLAVAFPNPDARISLLARLTYPMPHLTIDSPEIFNSLDPGIHPSLVCLDEKSRIHTAEPIGNPNALHDVLGRLLSKGTF